MRADGSTRRKPWSRCPRPPMWWSGCASSRMRTTYRNRASARAPRVSSGSRTVSAIPRRSARRRKAGVAMAGEGFLSRWSRRKQDVRAGKEVEEKDTAEAQEQPAPEVAPQALQVPQEQPAAAGAQPPEAPMARKPPGPSLEDVRALTFESDFKRFVGPGVAPEVKNAAVKKLFADPRF